MLTINNVQFNRYEILSLDVWGNEKDGFDVNASYRTNTFVTLPKDFTDADVIRALKAAGYVRNGFQFKSFTIEGDDEFLCIDHATKGPVAQLALAE